MWKQCRLLQRDLNEIRLQIQINIQPIAIDLVDAEVSCIKIILALFCVSAFAEDGYKTPATDNPPPQKKMGMPVMQAIY